MGFAKYKSTLGQGQTFADIQQEGLADQARAELPSEQLGTIPTPGPEQAGAERTYNVGDSATGINSEIATSEDVFASLFGQEYSDKPLMKTARTATSEQAKRAFNVPTPKVALVDSSPHSPLPVVGGTTDVGGDFDLQTPEQISASREQQLLQEAIPDFDVTSGRIDQAAAAEAKGERVGALDLTDPAANDFSLDEDILGKGLETDSEFAFDSYSDVLKKTLEKQMEGRLLKGDSMLSGVLTKAGILIPNTTKIKPEAARALLFTAAVEGKINETKKDVKIQEAADAVDRWHATGGKEGIPENEIDKHLQYSIMMPTFDRQETQTLLPTRFQQIFQGVDPISKESKSPLSPGDQSFLSVALMDSMKQMGMVDEVMRKDPDSGRTRGGYEKTEIFDKVMKPISDIISEYDSKFKVDVSLVELPGGAPIGDAALSHNATTRSPGKVKLERAGIPWKAADVAGRTPFTVSGDAMTGNAVLLAGVMASEKHKQLGFYDSQFASNFLLDKNTLFKYVPTKTEVAKDLELEIEEWELYMKNRKSNEEARPKPTIMETSQVDYTTPDAFILDYDKLYKAKDDFPSPKNIAIFEDFMKHRGGPAISIFRAVSGGYLKELKDGARLNGKAFYYPQTIQAGTTRTQIGTTTLNYQANKKARGLVANVLKYLVRGRTANDLRAGKAGKKRNMVFEAIIARNLSEGNVDGIGKADRASSIEKQAEALSEAMQLNNGKQSDLEQVARYVSKMLDANADTTVQWAKSVDEHTANLRSLNIPMKHIRPDVMLKNVNPFPEFTVAMPADVDQASTAELQKKLAIMMKLIDKEGKPLGKSDHGDFVLRSLKALGDYIAKPTVRTDLTVEPDGIASGLIIQGRQFGDTDYLEHGGVLYDGEVSSTGETTPLGDMRDLIHGIITKGRNDMEQSALETLNFPAEQQAVFTRIYKTIAEAKKVKAMHKAAAMTVAYSMTPKYAAQESVKEFMEGIRGTELFNDISKEADIMGLTMDQTQEAMYKIEQVAITKALGTSINQAKAVENAAGVAKVVNEIYEFEGANKWMMQLSGYESLEVASEVYVPVGGGKSSVVSTYMTFGDPAAAGKSKKGTPTRKMGSKGEKQAAVMPTQGIDATIAQETMIGIHNELARYDASKPIKEDTNFAWGGQVFDAFILDVGSYERGVDIANRKFESVNDGYSIMEKHIEAVDRLIKKAQAKAKQYADEGRNFDVSPDGEYRGMFYALSNIVDIAKKIQDTGFKGIEGAITPRDAKDKLSRPGINFKPEGGEMTPGEWFNAFRVYLNVTATTPVLRAMNSQIESSRAKVKQQIEDQIADGRPIREYG